MKEKNSRVTKLLVSVVFITASFAHAQPDNYRPDARTVLRLIRNDKLDLVLPGAMRDNSVEKVVEKARGILTNEPAYLTFDMDVLDPAYAPGTGGLEIGGLTTRDAQLLLRGMYGLNFVDPTGNTALVAANIMFEELCLLADCIHRRRNRGSEQ